MISKSQFIIFSALLATVGAPEAPTVQSGSSNTVVDGSEKSSKTEYQDTKIEELTDAKIAKIYAEIGMKVVSAKDFNKSVKDFLNVKKSVEKLEHVIKQKKLDDYANEVKTARATAAAEQAKVQVDVPPAVPVLVPAVDADGDPIDDEIEKKIKKFKEAHKHKAISSSEAFNAFKEVPTEVYNQFAGILARDRKMKRIVAEAAEKERTADAKCLEKVAENLKGHKQFADSAWSPALNNMIEKLYDNEDPSPTGHNITAVVEAIKNTNDGRDLEGLLYILRKLVARSNSKSDFNDDIEAAEKRIKATLSKEFSSGAAAVSAVEILNVTDPTSPATAPESFLDLLLSESNEVVVNKGNKPVEAETGTESTKTQVAAHLSLLDMLASGMSKPVELGKGTESTETQTEVRSDKGAAPAGETKSGEPEPRCGECRRRLATTAVSVGSVDQVVVQLFVDAEELVKKLKIENLSDDTFDQFKSDVQSAEGKVGGAEAVLKLQNDVESKAGEIKSARATALGLGLGLALGIPALAAVMFTVLVKTNRLLLNFGSTAAKGEDV